MGDEGFIRAMRESPEDDAVRLVYADWLEEHGEAVRAEVIRVQVELEPPREQWGNERRRALQRREADLLREHCWVWLYGPSPLREKYREDVPAVFRRGFVETVGLPVQWLLEDGAAVRALCPLLRRLDVHR